MAAPEGWTVIDDTEKDNFPLIPSTNSKKSFINDYFEMVDECQMKCRLCSTTVKVKGKNNWGMKSHVKNNHPAVWFSKFEPFVKPKASAKANSKSFERISPDVAQTSSDLVFKEEDGSHFCESDYGTMESNTYDQTESMPTTFEIVEFDNELTKKRKKTFHNHLDHNNGGTSSDRFMAANGAIGRNLTIDSIDASSLYDVRQMGAKSQMPKDEFVVFGDFIATELRNMKTDEFRRKLKHAVQKCLLDMVAEEDAALAEQKTLTTDH